MTSRSDHKFNFQSWVASLPGEYKYSKRRFAAKILSCCEMTVRRLEDGYMPRGYENYKKIAMTYKKYC